MLENKSTESFHLFEDNQVIIGETFKELVERWKLSGIKDRTYCQGRSVYMTNKEAVEYAWRHETEEEIERILSIYMERECYSEDEKSWWTVDVVEKQFTDEDLV